MEQDAVSKAYAKTKQNQKTMTLKHSHLNVPKCLLTS